MNNKEPLRLWLPELNSFQITKVREFLKAEYDRGFKDGQSAGVLDGEINQDINCTCDEYFGHKPYCAVVGGAE